MSKNVVLKNRPSLIRPTAGALLLLVVNTVVAAPPVVLQPDGVNDRVATGVDYATSEIGDPWDMDGVGDMAINESVDLDGESFVSGIYSATTTPNPSNPSTSRAHFWPIFPGLQVAVRLENGHKFPIDTSKYRYFSAKVRMTDLNGGPPGNQPFLVYFFEDAFSVAGGTFGNTSAKLIPEEQWTIVEFDMYNDVPSSFKWLDFPTVEGLRVDPTNNPDVLVEVDWIRLTAEPVTATNFEVQWTGNGAASYTITAHPVDGSTSLELATGVTGTSASVGLAALPPGDYDIEVRGGGESGFSQGPVSVNDPPLITFTDPDIKGDQSRSYGIVVNGNDWQFLDSGDVERIEDFISHSYSTPPGSFYGRPDGSTSRIIFETPVEVDTQLYRMVCFRLQVFGPRDVGGGSVAKLYFGDVPSMLTSSGPFIVHAGMNEYCTGDMKDLVTLPATPPGETQWIGALENFRIDPHEFQLSSECTTSPSPENCREIELDSMVLAPFDQAHPTFDMSWISTDADDNATIDVYLDLDQIPGSGNETLVFTGNENSDSGFTINESVTSNGTYFVYGEVDDGLNSNIKYADGPLVLGPAETTDIEIIQPDGLNDLVMVADEYALHDLGNAWDFSDAGDVNAARSANITNDTISGGIFSATSTSNGALFMLVHPDDGQPAMSTTAYRYLTVKMRASGNVGQQFFQVLFNQTGSFGGAQLKGITEGVALPENEWTQFTVDLLNDLDVTSSLTWDSASTMAALRIDPTNKTGATFEIDWITLTGAPTAASDYDIIWSTADAIDGATLNVSLVDALGYAHPVATGLSPDVSNFTASLTRLPLGNYHAQIEAIPGPVRLSNGPLSVVLTTDDAIFDDDFE